MGYNFLDHLKTSKDYDEMVEYKQPISTNLKFFNREFYKIGERQVCQLGDFLDASSFEIYNDENGTMSTKYTNREKAQWLREFKIIFNMKKDEDFFEVKEGTLITIDVAIAALEKLIQTNQKIVDGLNKKLQKLSGKPEEKTYVHLRNTEETNLKNRKILLKNILNKRNGYETSQRTAKKQNENINESAIRAKGLQIEIIAFTKSNIKPAVDLRDLLSRLGAGDAEIEYPLHWLKIRDYFNACNPKNGDNIYVNPLSGVTYCDIDLAKEICLYFQNIVDTSFAKRKIDLMITFLNKHYSMNNPRKILEDEALPDNAYILSQKLKELTW